MLSKTCINCEIDKPISEYYAHKQMGDGHLGACKECVKLRTRNNPNEINYYRSKKGVVRTIYKLQTRHSRLRGHDAPEYTKQGLASWLYKNNFNFVYDGWVKSGYEKDAKPSVDRIDSDKGYTFDNMRLGTWKDNREAQYNDILEGKGSSGRRCRAVVQYDKTMQEVGRYFSQMEASRKTGVCNKSISLCCKGKTKTAGGFAWSLQEVT